MANTNANNVGYKTYWYYETPISNSEYIGDVNLLGSMPNDDGTVRSLELVYSDGDIKYYSMEDDDFTVYVYSNATIEFPKQYLQWYPSICLLASKYHLLRYTMNHFPYVYYIQLSSSILDSKNIVRTIHRFHIDMEM